MREIRFRYWNGKCLYNSEVLKPINELFVEPDVIDIMEYTGLIDKDNKDICEGDVLEVFDTTDGKTKHMQCIRSEGSFWLVENELEFEPIFWLDKPYMKIIGNIYENPELRIMQPSQSIDVRLRGLVADIG